MKYRFLLFLLFVLNLLSAQSVDSVAIKQVDSLILVSQKLTEQRNFDKALEVNAAAEKIALEKLGKESAACGRCAFTRGRVNYAKGDYHESEKWYLESKAICERVLGKENPDYAKILIALGNLYEDVGQYEQSEQFYLDSRVLLSSLYGNYDLSYAGNLNNLGLLYKSMGKFEEAETLLVEQKTILEKVFGTDHPDYSTSLISLANLYLKIGLFEKAEKLYLEAETIDVNTIGREHPNYAITLFNIGLLYKSIGNFVKAEDYLLNAIAIDEKTIGKDHLDYASDLGGLANLYYSKGNYEKSQLLNREIMKIVQKKLGRDNPYYASILHNLANNYAMIGDLEKAEPIYLESMSIRKEKLGKAHPDYAVSLCNLGLLYFDMQEYEKADPLYLEAKVIQEKMLGKEHPDYANSLRNLVELYETQSRFSVSAPLIAESHALDQARLSRAISFLSERELANYAATFQNNGDGLGSYVLARLTATAIGAEVKQMDILPALIFDHALFYKGFLLTAAAQLNTIAEASPESKELSLRLKSYRRRLSAEYAKPIAERKNVPELEEKANTAEKELARTLAGYTEAKRQVKWEEIMSNLKKEEAAIEFVSFKVNFPKKTDSIMYAALLLKPGTKMPQFIPLFEEKSLDSLLQSKSDRKADYVNSLYTLADRGVVPVEAPKKSLYEILWKPLEKELTGIKTIYFSPSGLLHRINLDAVPISEAETLADKYQLIELNSTRQLVIPTQVKIANNDAVLFGGIQFEQDSTLQNSEPLIASRSRAELSFNSLDSTLRGGSWNYLAGTEREVNSIEKLILAAGMKVNLKKGYQATEESFKNIGANNAASPRILHIATHGYFFPDPKSTAKRTGLSGEQESVFKMSDHPMLRSGLIMAGGNTAWQGKQTLEGREDGILTAYEISQMNLSNTELVVLSACETGLGEIQGNEGVYGLQRAFKIAGAKYLIMSLWQVPDKQTSLLMTTFYKKWLEDKMTIPDAFRAAQKELREIGLDPYQWAGFVLVE